MTSSLIEGLMVSKQLLSKDKRVQCVKLPKLDSRQQILVDSAETATPEKLKSGDILIASPKILPGMTKFQ